MNNYFHKATRSSQPRYIRERMNYNGETNKRAIWYQYTLAAPRYFTAKYQKIINIIPCNEAKFV